jgi:hypothetical protein
MIGARVVLAVVFVAFVFSLQSLKYCFNCNLLPGKELTVSKCAEYDEPYESKVSLASAGFLSPSTLHTIKIEDTNGDVNCWAACSLGLTRNCSEPGRRVCPSDVCTHAAPTVTFEDLAEGEYTVSVNCEESGICYAEPKEFTFLVQQQTAKSGVMSREIPLTNIKLHKDSSGRCSNEKVWRSRITCFAVLETLMGVVFLLISLRDKEGERMPPFFMEDKKWVLQSRSRS